MGDIIDIDQNKPHIVSELMCWHCGYRYISVRLQYTDLKLCACPKCGKTGGMFNTGQDYEEIDE